MQITFYHNPRCSKSRAVDAILTARQSDATVVEYLKHPFSADTLREIIAALDVPAAGLIRTKDEEFRKSGIDPTALDDDTVIAILLRSPALLQRPVVVVDQQARICRPPERVLELLQ
ncbi:MAG: arsenate reductase (glutaredoxin) [Gammaproteobacteria bacterium]|nr:arsenate reductase (glutaredoxin) [Gammaproteobacteria bacterium]